MTEDHIRSELHKLINQALPDAPFTYDLDYRSLAVNSLELVELLCANRRIEAEKPRP